VLKRISRDQVTVGMFIHAFDGPWLQHPFWLPRFLLKAPQDRDKILTSDLQTLVIDESRGRAAKAECMAIAGDRARSPKPLFLVAEQARPNALRKTASASDRVCRFVEERASATKLIKQSTLEMRRIFADIRLGHAIQTDDVAPLVAGISASLTRNKFALIRLTRLKSRDEYTYVHSIAVSALMVSLGRTLDLSPQVIFDLGMAGLLHDVGKIVVPTHILSKPESLTAEEFALVRTHPEQGYRMLSIAPGIPPIVLDVCRHHHERMDGTGYPFKLTGDVLSLPARIGAICDVYDALTSDRAYKSAWTPQEAISRMHEWTGHFDPGLLFQFMKTVSVFPAGLLVLLRSNRLGVVMPNGRRASRIMVRAFYATRERCVIPHEDVPIGDTLNHDQIMGEEDPASWGLADWKSMSEQIIR